MTHRLELKDYPTGCVCQLPADLDCLCGDEERLVRARLYDVDVPPFTQAERENIAWEADLFAKGEYNYHELLKLPDKDLAGMLVGAWVIMARKHGLI